MGGSVADALQSLDRKLEHVLEPEMRRVVVREWLEGLEPRLACEGVATVLHRSVPHDRLRGVICELLGGGAEEGLSYDLRCELYAEAAGRDDDVVLRLLRSLPAREVVAEPERLLSRELAEIPLGRRRSLARGNHPRWFEELARDSDPVVIRHLLQNPRTVEADVVRMAATRPAAASTLAEIAQARRWNVRPRVRAALARNPYCPADIAVEMVARLPLPELRAMRYDPDLHPETRAQLEAELARCGAWQS